jgi:NADPH:quinone reductase-like Zn-dependent oxidoreductase
LADPQNWRLKTCAAKRSQFAADVSLICFSLERSETTQTTKEQTIMAADDMLYASSLGAKVGVEVEVNVYAAKDDEEDVLVESIQKDDSEQPCSASLLATQAKASRAKKGRMTDALPHADISYSPSLGVELTEYESLPDYWEDEVLIRVEATTISTRDCLERIRRDNNEKLKDESWVPGHEIVGRVVRAGTKARFLNNSRVAALLPDGGGNSRYVRCHLDNLIAVPEDASSQDIVYLLSTYLTAYQCLEHSIEVNQTSCCVGPTLQMAESEDYEDDVLEVDEEGASVSAGRRRSPLFGKSILITGAGSPVGLALVDVARHAGANVYALSHSQHEDSVVKMGVKGWYPLFQKEAWTRSWRGKMDVIVDTIGDYDNYTSFYDVLLSGGRFVRLNTTSSGKKFVPVLLGMQGDGGELFSLLKDYKGSHINKVAVDYDILARQTCCFFVITWRWQCSVRVHPCDRPDRSARNGRQ